MADIGNGVIILLVLWSIALFFIIVFCSSQGKLKLLAVLPCIIAAIVTIVLLSLPNQNNAVKDDHPNYYYSYTSLIWILLLTLMCITLTACLVIYFLSDIMESRYAYVTKVAGIKT